MAQEHLSTQAQETIARIMYSILILIFQPYNEKPSRFVIQSWVSTEPLPYQDISVSMAHSPLPLDVHHRPLDQKVFENTGSVKRLSYKIGIQVSFR